MFRSTVSNYCITDDIVGSLLGFTMVISGINLEAIYLNYNLIYVLHRIRVTISLNTVRLFSAAVVCKLD